MEKLIMGEEIPDALQTVTAKEIITSQYDWQLLNEPMELKPQTNTIHNNYLCVLYNSSSVFYSNLYPYSKKLQLRNIYLTSGNNIIPHTLLYTLTKK